ncbi:MAG: DUF3772 domain-containing protein [Caulobacteraceae bacterium]|nr:DUF3772 domain-containing protein [Caulobacteraceae bacterium]
MRASFVAALVVALACQATPQGADAELPAKASQASAQPPAGQAPAAQAPATQALATQAPATQALAAQALAAQALAATPSPTPSAPGTGAGSSRLAVPPAAAPTSLAPLRQQLAQLQNQAQAASNDGLLAAMGARAAAIRAAAQQVAAAEASQLAAVSRDLQRTLPRRGRRQSQAQHAEQAALLTRQASLTTTLSDANATVSAANGVFDLIAERRREGFSARVLERSASPLSPDFWTSLAGGVGGDVAQLTAVVKESAAVALEAREPRGLLGLLLGLAAAVVFAFPARRRLEALARREASKRHPAFGRTGAALWLALVDTALPALAAGALRLGLEWGGLLSRESDELAGAGVVAVAWAAAVLALSRVLATDMDARHRLLPLPDDTARRIRIPVVAVALVTASGFLLTRLNYVVGASVAATIAANCLLSLAYSAVSALILVSFGRSRASEIGPATGAAGPRSPTWTLLSLLLTIAILLTLGALFGGYTVLAALTSSQIFWLSIIAAIAYLLVRFVDDLCAAMFRDGGWASRTLFVLFNFRRSTIRQTGVLTSAALQLVIIAAALSLALTPFGESGELLFSSLRRFGGAIRLGSAIISPASIASGVAALFIGMTLVHMLQRWIVRRYLPVTEWDLGVRNSVSTGVGYLGSLLALLAALAAMGLSLSQVALIASALSVGIGFGLQQIVQNFVSGVILLIERPVKVGDWVNVGGVEGDVRRIRVRATEIQTPDRSTVIVPNANLITNPVQNKTLGDPRARIQLQLSIAHGADALRARDVFMQAARADPRVLKDPPPEVYIDSLASGAVSFLCNVYVADLREASKIRSDLYFEILRLFESSRLLLAGAA